MHGIRNLPEASQDYLDKTELSGQPLLPWSNILVRKLVEIFLDHLSCHYSSRHCRTWKYIVYILKGNSNKESHRKKLKYTYRTCGHNCNGIIMMPCKSANIKLFISFFCTLHFIWGPSTQPDSSEFSNHNLQILSLLLVEQQIHFLNPWGRMVEL